MFTKTDEAYERLLRATPCGSQTLSKMPCRFVEGIYPKVLDSGINGVVWDLDGNRYIDLISGLGAVSVGYSDPQVNLAAYEQIAKGVSFSLPTVLEAEVSERLCELVPETEMWKFGKNGTDATVMAVRVARAYTGRMKVLSVGYNGCADVFEAAGTRRAGIPDILSQFIHKAVYNDLETFQCLRDETYACLIMEPMVYEAPDKEFLEQVRKLCSLTGTVLIFDEVVNGGRFSQFVSQSYFGVLPDLTCLGKAIANGFPLCAVGGKRQFMAVFERDDFFASGTFGGEAVSLACCLATVNKLLDSIPRMVWNGSRIKEAFNKIFNGKATCLGYPTRLIFKFSTPELKALFMQEMCLQGVLIGQANMVMANHTDQNITDVINAIYGAYRVLNDNWLNPVAAMKGKMPEDALRK